MREQARRYLVRLVMFHILEAKTRACSYAFRTTPNCGQCVCLPSYATDQSRRLYRFSFFPSGPSRPLLTPLVAPNDKGQPTASREAAWRSVGAACSAHFISVRYIWFIAPDSRSSTVSSCSSGTVCSGKRRTDPSTISGTVHKPITDDGSDITTVHTIHLLTFDPAHNRSRTAINCVA